MADVGRLGSSFGKVAGQLLTMKQREQEAALKQEQIDLTNNLIQEAIGLDKKLSQLDTTPFLRNKKIFDHISKREREFGLPTGTALSTYKQFFSMGAGGESGDISKWDKKEYGNYGYERINPNDPTQRVLIKYDQNAVAASAYIDNNTKMADEVSKDLAKFGVWAGLTEQQKIEITKNPAAVYNIPETRAVMERITNLNNLEQKSDVLKQSKNITTYEIENEWRKADVPNTLVDVANKLINMQTENKDLTPQDVLSKWNSTLSQYQKIDPDAYNNVCKPISDMLTQLIKDTHPSTRAKFIRDEYKDEREYIEDQNAMMKALVKRSSYRADRQLVAVDVMADTFRSLNPQTLKGIRIGTNTDANSIYTLMGDAMENVGIDQWKKDVSTYNAEMTKKFADLDLTTEKVGEQDVFKEILQLAMYGSDDNIAPQGLNRLYNGVNWIRANPKHVKSTNEAIDEYIKGLSITDETYRSQIHMLTRLKNMINSER